MNRLRETFKISKNLFFNNFSDYSHSLKALNVLTNIAHHNDEHRILGHENVHGMEQLNGKLAI